MNDFEKHAHYCPYCKSPVIVRCIFEVYKGHCLQCKIVRNLLEPKLESIPVPINK